MKRIVKAVTGRVTGSQFIECSNQTPEPHYHHIIAGCTGSRAAVATVTYVTGDWSAVAVYHLLFFQQQVPTALHWHVPMQYVSCCCQRVHGK